MELEDEVVAMTINVAGFTEEDIWKARALLMSVLSTYRISETDLDLYRIDMTSHEGVPIMALLLQGEYWDNFSALNDIKEYAYMMCQPAIWGELH